MLYLDCDTVLFGDIARVFECSGDDDWYAREEAWGIKEAVWEQTSIAQTGRFVPPFNTGVCLVRPALRDALSSRIPELLNFYARLQGASGPAVGSGDGSPIPSPTTNPWIHEEVALWLTLGLCEGMSFGNFRREYVIQSLEFVEVDPARGKMPIVCHHFNNHRDDFDKWQRRHARALALCSTDEADVVDATALPALDDAPSYLETGLWDRSIHDWNVAAAREMNPTVTVNGDSVDFVDPFAGIQRVFRLGPELREIIYDLGSDPATVDDLSPALRERLMAAGILVDGDNAICGRCAWESSMTKARRQFLQEGYATLPQLLSPIHLAWLRCRYRRLVRVARLEYGDGQCPTRWVSHNEPAARALHRSLARVVSDVAGQPVKPSYLYLGCYEAGSTLPEHVDREQCEFSITMLVDYVPEPEGASPWPIYLRPTGEAVPVHQRLGEALLYRGRQIPHFRETLQEGNTSTSLFFHFVEESFRGKLN